MSSNSLQRLTEKKGKQLSKILGINSGPSTEVIADMQARINNPLFKLSIADYEAMCGNKMIVKMMSKVIGCDVKQLTKLCKYINVFAENIESSPKSIMKKIKETISINASKRRGSLHVLPEDILEKIVNKYKTIFKIKYVLKDWIPLEKLDWKHLSGNPNAIELLKENPKKINWDSLSINPNAMELLKANPTKINWTYLSKNPNAIDLLKDKINAEKLMNRAYLYNLDDSKKINWYYLSENPNAIELLKANPDKIDWDILLINPRGIELFKKYPEIINLTELYIDSNYINWTTLSANPSREAVEILKANPESIDWFSLSANPNAIDLIKDKIDEENRMSEDDYDNLKEYEKINWCNLSRNPNPEAIELLKANPEKINWSELSANPNANDLIKNKIDEENRLSENDYKKLNYKHRISLGNLSRNPNPKIIEMLKKKQNKLDWIEWNTLSRNPAIFDEVLY
jgi:hypothetical protein